MSTYRVRRVISEDDLRACLAIVGRHFSPPMPADDIRFDSGSSRGSRAAGR